MLTDQSREGQLPEIILLSPVPPHSQRGRIRVCALMSEFLWLQVGGGGRLGVIEEKEGLNCGVPDVSL